MSTTFGTSAFLRLVSSTPRVQRSIIRQRLRPSESAYDFHRMMRTIAGEFVRGAATAEVALAACDRITALPERNAAKLAIRKLIHWRGGVPGTATHFSPATYESPEGAFRVTFRPDFAMNLDGELTAVHLWNTQAPRLDIRLAQAALSLFPPVYGPSASPGDLAIFSLRELRFIRLREADVGLASIASNLVARIDSLFDEISDELHGPGTHPAPLDAA